MMRRPHRARRGGFTLIELLVSVAILGVLATMVTPVVQLQVQRSRELQLREALRDMRRAIDAYKAASDDGRIARRAGDSGYPPSLQVLVEGVPDRRDPEQRTLRFLRRIPADPFSAGEPPVWGLRSYASDAENPRPGNDVFDVYSTSRAVGLNGVAYAKW